MSQKTPVFTIIGHPNEGKSSVLSTLSEDDSIKVGPMPGETRLSQRFPVRIDSKELIAFIDTPGFQNPHKILEWFQSNNSSSLEKIIGGFASKYEDQKEFLDDCQLLQSLLETDGIIFVVDGSRPIREFDHTEMEIMRLSGIPRMALMNNKEDGAIYLKNWEQEFRKYFNSIRNFNSNKANFQQRIALLNSLKFIDQNLEQSLNQVILAFEKDWESRVLQTSELIVQLVKDLISYQKVESIKTTTSEKNQKECLYQEFLENVRKKERQFQNKIRTLYKHEKFDLQLPKQSILNQDLFSEKTWDFLGLTNKQLIVAGTLGGAAIGVGVDAALAGTSHGIFAAIGGLVGGVTAAWKGKDFLSGKNLMGFDLLDEKMQIGPIKNNQFLYILIDRCLLYYSHIIDWSHGRRDYQSLENENPEKKIGHTHSWSSSEHRVCQNIFMGIQKNKLKEEHEKAFFDLLCGKLNKISEISSN